MLVRQNGLLSMCGITGSLFYGHYTINRSITVRESLQSPVLVFFHRKTQRQRQRRGGLECNSCLQQSSSMRKYTALRQWFTARPEKNSHDVGTDPPARLSLMLLYLLRTQCLAPEREAMRTYTQQFSTERDHAKLLLWYRIIPHYTTPPLERAPA